MPRSSKARVKNGPGTEDDRMMMARWIAGLVALIWVGVMAGPGWSQSQPAEDHGLLVVYGALAPSREGDTDRREQIFVSFPANLRDRVFLAFSHLSRELPGIWRTTIHFDARGLAPTEVAWLGRVNESNGAK